MLSLLHLSGTSSNVIKFFNWLNPIGIYFRADVHHHLVPVWNCLSAINTNFGLYGLLILEPFANNRALGYQEHGHKDFNWLNFYFLEYIYIAIHCIVFKCITFYYTLQYIDQNCNHTLTNGLLLVRRKIILIVFDVFVIPMVTNSGDINPPWLF